MKQLRKNLKSYVIKKLYHRRLILLIIGIILSAPLLSTSPVYGEENSVMLDLESPIINFIHPGENGERISSDNLQIEIEVIDQDSGINQKDIILSIDGVDISKGAEIERKEFNDTGSLNAMRIKYKPFMPLISGSHRIQIVVKDNAGNQSRKQLVFYIESEVDKVKWDIGLNNTINYTYLPLQKFNNITNFISRMQLENQLFTMQIQGSAADYPGITIEPNQGDFYADIDQYFFEWQSDYFILQYGDLTIPFDSGLIQYGLGFKGFNLESKGNWGGQWTLFQGNTASSAGLGISLIDSIGGSYSWQTGTANKKIYFLQMDSGSSSNYLGFYDERAFPTGIMNYEAIYGEENEGDEGAGIHFAGGTSLLDIFWNIDFTMLQSTFPQTQMAVLPVSNGGALQFRLNGDKVLEGQKNINFSYTQLRNNLDNSQRDTRVKQSINVNYSGIFSDDYIWNMEYQIGINNGSIKNEQQILRLGIDRNLSDSSWSSGLRIIKNNSENSFVSRKHQWNVSYNKLFTPFDLDTTTTLQISNENDEDDKSEENKYELSFSAEKDFFQDILNSNLILRYKIMKERGDNSLFSDSEAFEISTGLTIYPNDYNRVKVNGSVSFWEENESTNRKGTDYRINLSWLTKIF